MDDYLCLPPDLGTFCVEYVFSPCTHGYSGFLPQTKSMHIRPIDNSKNFLGVFVPFVSDGPLVDYPVQSILVSYAMTVGIRHQLCNP